jgi:hypothetical protein
MSSVPTALSADATSLAAAQANQLASSTAMVAQLNSNLTVIYNTAFNSWCTNVNAGRIPNTNPPQPPVQYVVSGPDKQGFQWPVLDPSGTPVCAMPPVPPDGFTVVPKVPNTIDVGPNIGGKWFSVAADDTFPAGMTTPPIADASGALHTYEKYAAPVGAGWYLQVS